MDGTKGRRRRFICLHVSSFRHAILGEDKREKKRERIHHLSLLDRSGKLAATTEGKKEKRKAEEIIYNAVLSIRDRFSTVQDKKGWTRRRGI